MLQIEGPMLDVGSLKIRVDSIEVLNSEADNRISGKRIIEGSRIDDRFRLEWRVSANYGFPRIKRHLIKVDAVSGSYRSGTFLKRVPGNSKTRREIIGSSRNGLAKR